MYSKHKATYNLKKKYAQAFKPAGPWQVKPLAESHSKLSVHVISLSFLFSVFFFNKNFNISLLFTNIIYIKLHCGVLSVLS